MTLAMEGRYHPYLSQRESALEISTVLSACVFDILSLLGCYTSPRFYFAFLPCCSYSSLLTRKLDE